MDTSDEGNMVDGKPEISIIIPAYQVEWWLSDAILSLEDQTYQDFEIIIIDDGSPDQTGQIADELAAEDPRIRVIHQQNAGAAEARNAGMAEARGTFLYFMDGDDWCEPTMLRDMRQLAVDHDLDLVVTGFYIDTYYGGSRKAGTGRSRSGRFYRESRNAPDAIYDNAQDFRSDAATYFFAQLLYAPWNKLYRRSYIEEHHITFPSTFWDDLPFNLLVLRDIQRVGMLDGHYYHFLRAREESENTRYRPDMYEKREEEDHLMRELFSYWNIDDQESKELLALRYAERLIGCIENVTNRDCTLDNEEKRRQVKAMLETPRAREALALAQPRSTMMKQLLAPMKRGDVSLTLLQCSVISWVKRNQGGLFARLKAHRQKF